MVRYVITLCCCALSYCILTSHLQAQKAHVPVYRGKALPQLESSLVTIKPNTLMRRIIADGEEIIVQASDGTYYQVIPAISSLLLTALPDYKPKPINGFNKPVSPNTTAAFRETGDIRYAWYSHPTKVTAEQKTALPNGLNNVLSTQLNVMLTNGSILVYKSPEGTVFEDNRPLITDLQNDGLNEVIVTKRVVGEGTYASLLMPSLNKLIPVLDFPKEKHDFWSKAVAAEDFDGDGYSEVAAIVAPEAISYFKLYEIQSGKPVEQDSAYGYQVPDRGQAVLMHDFNKDGLKDLFVVRNDLQGLNIITYARGFLERLMEQELKSRIKGAFAVAYKDGYPYRLGFLLNNGRIAMLILNVPE